MADSPQSSDGAHSTDARPLRILIGADTFLPDVNGAAMFAARLAAGLVARGHDVHVAAPATKRGPGTFIEQHEGATMTVHRIYSWRWYPHPWLRFALPWRIEKNAARILDVVKPDVVHFQSHIVVGRGLAKEAKKRGIRVIGTNHFMPENMLAHALIPPSLQKKAIAAAWRAAGRTFGLAETVTSPTRRAADFLEANTSLDHVLAISCGVDVASYRPDFGPRNENRIVFVGRITNEKQLDTLVRAVAKLDPSLDARLELVGGGELIGPLQQLAGQLGISDRVTFAGYVDDEYLKRTLSEASVFAMPSIAELQSIATMEAMASGLPIVAANAMALPHLVHDGENGYLFEPSNVDDLAEKLRRVFTLPQDKREAFQRDSLRIVADHDIQRTLTTFEELYRGRPVAEVVTAHRAEVERP